LGQAAAAAGCFGLQPQGFNLQDVTIAELKKLLAIKW